MPRQTRHIALICCRLNGLRCDHWLIRVFAINFYVTVWHMIWFLGHRMISISIGFSWISIEWQLLSPFPFCKQQLNTCKITFSLKLWFFLFFCLFAVFDVRACSPTNSCWIAFHWVPFIYSHSDVGLCVPILQCQTVSLCRPRCTEHEQKGNCDLFRARTPFTEIIITLQHQIIAYHITRKLLTHTHTHSFHRVQLPRRHNEIEFYICALNLILFFNFTR